jgi:gamma-glutamyltranspeptidase/glutathione hydrolase
VQRRAADAMVATGNPLAAEAALETLRAGGSAADAAIAADAVLGVVEPMATSIGGDLLAMIVEPGGRAACYNGSGRAPRALDVRALDALPGQRIPERHPLSVTTPGAVRGWHDLHARYGRLRWRELFAHAIRHARDGFAVAPVAAREWALFEHVIARDAHSARLYRAGHVPSAGERFDNPELAATLQAIASDGPDAFYQGAPARAASAACASAGGALATEDFIAHRGEFAEPLHGAFRGLTVLECPPNTHGVAVLRALGALDRDALDEADPATTVAMVDATRAALDEAKRTVADPAGNTVCTAVVDGDGLAITLMSSVFKRFGSGIAVPGCGFVLQNRGHGFAAPGEINGAAPGKRPYHTVVPAAALVDGRFHAVFGVVGGAMQPQGQIQLLVRIAAWRQSLGDAMRAPRWRLENARALAIEEGMSDAIASRLRAAGYPPPNGSGELAGRSDFGGAQFVMRAPDGRLMGASDPRKDGVVASPAGC